MKPISLLLAALLLLGCDVADKKIHGYVEGEFVRVAPTTSGLLKTLFVQRGQSVKAGDILYSLDLSDLRIEQKQANIDIGRLEADLSNVQKEYDRMRALRRTHAVSTLRFENAETALNDTKASLLKARQHAVQIEKKLREAAPKATESGLIQETYYEVGEYVNQGQAVVSLLPAGHIKIRFFVSQKQVAQLRLGQSLTVHCDGCATAFDATITYIAPNTEYTPPVIYSVKSRDKLVFLVEAKPKQYHTALRPGLPVSIDLSGAL